MSTIQLPAGFSRMSVWERHAALAASCLAHVNDRLAAAYARAETKTGRTAYYLSAEFLLGRLVYANLYNIGALSEAETLWQEAGASLSALSEIPDPALGNGGLGRLAACFLDSAATHGVPLWGYGIRYRYGLFRQNLQNGFQKEEPDDWTRMGDPWSIRREYESVSVPLCGTAVRAVPYDMPIIGYGGGVTVLRLWQAEAESAPDFAQFDVGEYAKAAEPAERAARLSLFLYPNDSTPAGRALRLSQEAFFTAASVSDLLRRYERTHGYDYTALPDTAIFQLNDTHPVLAIPTLIYQLEERGISFANALAMARKMFAYTNHTVMAEALETWEADTVRQVVPHLWQILVQIDEQLTADFAARRLSTENVHIIENDRVHMANLAAYVCDTVNGVARLHTEILKRDVLADWERAFLGKIQNKTNGITQRRWLGVANPALASVITERIGDSWITDLSTIAQLKQYAGDTDTLHAIWRAKAENKQLAAAAIHQSCGISVDTDMLFDVQIKRLHEYKRQLMNALSILYLYFDVKDGVRPDLTPTAFLFGAKSAPGYARAKGVIRLILQIAEMIHADTSVRDRMRVIFVPDYNVSWAEKLIAAGELSEQISMAGTEASGTGNMKFMLNGAPTLGTLDGANLEILEAAGAENNFFFGVDAAAMRQRMEHYRPAEILARDARLRRVVDTLIDGTFDDGGSGIFAELHHALCTEDRYCVLGDFADYLAAKSDALRAYRSREAWARRALNNIASAGRFSSDRTVREYARDIWRV